MAEKEKSPRKCPVRAIVGLGYILHNTKDSKRCQSAVLVDLFCILVNAEDDDLVR